MILLEPEIERLMLKDAQNAFPDECFGFLFGREKGSDRFVSEIMEMDWNDALSDPTTFEISSREYLLAERFAIGKDLALLGVYHAHSQRPAAPTEQEQALAFPNLTYLFILMGDRQWKEMRAWRLNETVRFEEEDVRLGVTAPEMEAGVAAT